MVIGVIGAMDEEIAQFINEMQDVETEVYAGTRYYRGMLQKKNVVVAKTGVGKVNAALCTSVLIDRFQVDAVIFTGVAGALHPELRIGDVVISTEAQQHDVDAHSLGFARGTIPFQEKSIFTADPRLVQLAEQAAQEVTGGKVMKGKVLSGDQFISDANRVKKLRQDFDGVCVEMEGAAVAHVCHLHGIPFVIIRSMSDRADQSAHVNFAEFTELAAQHSGAMVRKMLASFPETG